VFQVGSEAGRQMTPDLAIRWLAGGPASLVIGVWDEIGGSESYVYQKVVVGGPN